MRSVISPISSRKMRAAVGHLELARLVAIGAGEAALDVAEQLRLEQRFRQAGAVDRDHARAAARALRWWMACATSSLPTPLSPVISTFASERAMRSISCASSPIAALLPISCPLPWRLILTRLSVSGVRSVSFAILIRWPYARNSSRLRRLFSSMPTNTAPSAGFDSRLGRSTMPLHLNFRGERRRADAGLQVRSRADRQLRLARQQRAASG